MSGDARFQPKKSGLLRRFGTRSTQLVAKLIGNHLPFYYISEYPRSGGTWLGAMLADYLDIPMPHQPLAPVLRSAVLHNHWGYSPRLRRVYYLCRDGRDVCTSMFFFCLRALAHENVAMRNYYAAKLPQAAREDWRAEDSREHMPKFIETWATNPMGCRITWKDHVEQWALGRPHVITISYEELRADCAAALSRIIPLHVDGPLDQEKIARVVGRHSFANQSGRQPGSQDANSFMRKGVVGDWRNHFNEAAAQAFNQHAGELLIQLGYERDQTWVERVPETRISSESTIRSL